MNCLEFRRMKLAAPNELSDAARGHAEICTACAELARSVNVFERDLEAAIKIPIEPALAQRIVLDRKLKTGRRLRVYALAASLMLAVGLGLSVGYRAFKPDPTLVAAAVDHVLGEPSAFRAVQQVKDEELAKALGISGATLSKSFAALVTYLHDCPVPGGMGKHIVLMTDAGKVTLITMPNQKMNWGVTQNHKGLMAALAPAQRGSFAIVADSSAAMAAAEKLLKEHVSWRA
jgi:hypothetical protein